MAEGPAIVAEDIELGGEARLWDVLRAALRAKEGRPSASLLPAMLILKSDEIVAKVYQGEDPGTLFVRSCTGVRRISFKWYDALLMLYRTAAMILEKMEGTAVIFLGERAPQEADHAMICAMKWTARQFLQQPPRGAKFPETRDSIGQAFYLDDNKVCWLPETNTALQFT